MLFPKNITSQISFLLALTFFLTACEGETPPMENPPKEITTLAYTLIPTAEVLMPY